MFTYNNEEFTENLGNSNRTVLASPSWVVKYGGRPWNMVGERDLFQLTSQGTADIIDNTYLVTERLTALPSTEESRLEAIPALLRDFHNLTPPTTVSQQTPVDNFKERLTYRLPSIAPGAEIDSIVKELDALLNINDAFKGKTLSHSDVNSSNVLLTNQGYRLIDFEWACANSVPEYDIASLNYINLYKHYRLDFNSLYGEPLNQEVMGYSVAVRMLSALSNYLWKGNLPGYQSTLAMFKIYGFGGYTGSMLARM